MNAILEKNEINVPLIFFSIKGAIVINKTACKLLGLKKQHENVCFIYDSLRRFYVTSKSEKGNIEFTKDNGSASYDSHSVELSNLLNIKRHEYYKYKLIKTPYILSDGSNGTSFYYRLYAYSSFKTFFTDQDYNFLLNENTEIENKEPAPVLLPLTQKTHIENQRDSRKDVINKVCMCLDITEEKHSEMMFENAYSYFNHHNFNDDLKEKLQHVSAFWSWWKTFYHLQDKSFINDYTSSPHLKGKSRTMLLNIYNENHYKLDVMPDRYVLDETDKFIKA